LCSHATATMPPGLVSLWDELGVLTYNNMLLPPQSNVGFVTISIAVAAFDTLRSY
jgi:hypothetical protein